MNLENKILNKVFFEELSKKNDIKKFVHVYATCLYDVPYGVIAEYMTKNFYVLYDFVL